MRLDECKAGDKVKIGEHSYKVTEQKQPIPDISHQFGVKEGMKNMGLVLLTGIEPQEGVKLEPGQETGAVWWFCGSQEVEPMNDN